MSVPRSENLRATAEGGGAGPLAPREPDRRGAPLGLPLDGGERGARGVRPSRAPSPRSATPSSWPSPGRRPPSGRLSTGPRRPGSSRHGCAPSTEQRSAARRSRTAYFSSGGGSFPNPFAFSKGTTSRREYKEGDRQWLLSRECGCSSYEGEDCGRAIGGGGRRGVPVAHQPVVDALTGSESRAEEELLCFCERGCGACREVESLYLGGIVKSCG